MSISSTSWAGLQVRYIQCEEGLKREGIRGGKKRSDTEER